MKLDEIEVEEKIIKSLESLRSVPALDDQAVAEERFKFLEHGEMPDQPPFPQRVGDEQPPAVVHGGRIGIEEHPFGSPGEDAER